MARLTLYQDNYIDSTVVSNCFIDEYMKDANDAQLKVYLYLIRMLNANQAISVSGIADKFNHTEKDVIRALKYWEKKSLLTLDYDEDKNLVGIHLRDLDAQPVQTKQTSVPMSFITQAALRTDPGQFPLTESAGNSHVSSDSTASKEQLDEPEERFPKPAYTPAQLREFKERSETAQLLFIAESYKGVPLTPAEMKSMLFFKDVLNFSDDLIDYLLQYCFDRDKKNFKYIERVAINWAEQGITTPKQAEKQSARYDKNVYAVMNELGKSGSPTAKELEYINRWMREYGFSMDIIFEACERTVMATDKHRFEYAEGILSSWKRANVHHKSDIRKIDDNYLRRRSTTSKSSNVTTNRFNQFTQNSYDFDALEKEILSN
ncbi:MAG: DnaD domain protein [Lachnospiraceae bacterium]|nr:DnaD domain protein [Lachnospiraceae bacterium]